MRKIALHWQILIALIAAILYGLSFPTHYQINEHTYKNLKRNHVPTPVQQQLSPLEGQTFSTMSGFINALNKLKGAGIKKQETAIIKAAYDNPPVMYISWMGDLFIRALKMLIIP